MAPSPPPGSRRTCWSPVSPPGPREELAMNGRVVSRVELSRDVRHRHAKAGCDFSSAYTHPCGLFDASQASDPSGARTGEKGRNEMFNRTPVILLLPLALFAAACESGGARGQAPPSENAAVAAACGPQLPPGAGAFFGTFGPPPPGAHPPRALEGPPLGAPRPP